LAPAIIPNADSSMIKLVVPINYSTVREGKETLYECVRIVYKNSFTA
jgi:hypothetical protein